MGPQDSPARRISYGVRVGIIVAAEIAAWLMPPRTRLPPNILTVWQFVNFAGAAVVMSALGLVYRKMLDRAERRVAEEQKVVERLLGNILPGPIADAYDAVTVMFADGVNFSEFAAHDSPTTVVDLLNHLSMLLMTWSSAEASKRSRRWAMAIWSPAD